VQAHLSPQSQKLLVSAALLPPPITLDDLVNSVSLSPLQVLQAMESLVTEGYLNLSLEGPGHYQLKTPEKASEILAFYSDGILYETAENLIQNVKKADMARDKKCLTIANIVSMTGLVQPAHLQDLIRAAHYCLETGAMEAATFYFKIIIENVDIISDQSRQYMYFIDASLGLISSHGHLMPLQQQWDLLERASACAESSNKLEKLCMVNLRLAQVIKTAGDYEKASVLYEKAWDLAKHLHSEDLLRQAALFTSDFLFWQGFVAQAVSRYEKVIGDAENFPADQATLRATATLGWCYGICGHTARGIGLIDAVRNKADGLNLTQVKVYADMMAVLTLLDSRRISEAETHLDAIFHFPEDTLGNYILWAGYASRAFIFYTRGDLQRSFKYQKMAFEKSEEVGWFHHRGPWNFDYIDALEEAGLVHPKMNYDAEIWRLLGWPDVYMQGVGFRYRALRKMKKQGRNDDIVSDLDKSTRLLTKAGARLELAHTQVLHARLMLQEEPASENARSLLKEAWKVLSNINPDLFPNELRPYLEDEPEEESVINTLLEVGDAIGTVRDRERLLTRIINLLMRLTRAGRGGVFLVDDRNNARLVASRNLDTAILESPQFRESWQVIAQVIETGRETIMSKNTGPGPGWLLCYPVMLRNHFFGVIYLDNTLVGLSPPQDIISLLKVVISQMGVAIDNANAYEEIEQLKGRLEQETRLYRMEMEGVPAGTKAIGTSEAMKRVLAKIGKVAATGATVLITGETGVGKELVAREIHRQSTRCKSPFIPVNTASFSSELIASELFGHEKGAFTGATHQHHGKFELADGGTLFLDDIDAISMDVQAKILRAIQEKEFERVGGSQTIRSDFRLIAATNADLTEMITEKKFRTDLYFRLNVFPIHIPPLRERKEDIHLLANYFLDIFNKKMGKHIRGFTKKELESLSRHSWPGNVRELKHIIERAVILSENGYAGVPELLSNNRFEKESDNAFPTYREMEKTHIVNALKKCGGRVSGSGGAAELLDLKPTTLYAKINKLGIRKKFL